MKHSKWGAYIHFVNGTRTWKIDPVVKNSGNNKIDGEFLLIKNKGFINGEVREQILFAFLKKEIDETIKEVVQETEK